MIERKPAKPGSGEQTPDWTGQAEPKPLRPEATMHMDIRSRKIRGRLSREDQRRLGDILHRLYDEVVKEGVPDRFDKLLRQLDQPGRATTPQAAIELTADDMSRGPAPEPAVRATDRDEPHNEGSS